MKVGRPKKGKFASYHPTARPGEAHLVIKSKILCKEKKYRNVRYYRDYCHWLVQPDKCPKCKEIFDKHFNWKV